MADRHQEYFDKVDGISGERDLLEHIYHTLEALKTFKDQYPNDATYRVLHYWLTLITNIELTNIDSMPPGSEIAFQYRLIDEADKLNDEQKDTIRQSYQNAFGDYLQDFLNENPAMGGGKKRKQKQKQRKTRARKHRKQRKTRKGRK